jgi:hypothetical protein
MTILEAIRAARLVPQEWVYREAEFDHQPCGIFMRYSVNDDPLVQKWDGASRTWKNDKAQKLSNDEILSDAWTLDDPTKGKV